jgi:ABC-type multidrug transport system ATPase subunit
MDMIVEFKRNGGTVVFTSHDVDVVAELSDYVYVLSGGQVVAHGEPEDVLCDDEALAKAELRPPTATMLYRELIGGGGRCPIKTSELLSILKGACKALEARTR